MDGIRIARPFVAGFSVRFPAEELFWKRPFVAQRRLKSRAPWCCEAASERKPGTPWGDDPTAEPSDAGRDGPA